MCFCCFCCSHERRRYFSSFDSSFEALLFPSEISQTFSTCCSTEIKQERHDDRRRRAHRDNGVESAIVCALSEFFSCLLRVRWTVPSECNQHRSHHRVRHPPCYSSVHERILKLLFTSPTLQRAERVACVQVIILQHGMVTALCY